MHIVFVPSITFTTDNDDYKYNCKVMKIDSSGKESIYPVVLSEGVCRSDVIVDFLQGDFTLYAVISDGTYNHNVGLVKIMNLKESGYGYEELWNN